VHRGDLPAGSGDGLERAVRAVELPEQRRTFVWIAGEADAVKPLRRWARDRGLPAGDVRITGYWKRGEADYDDD
jgi:NADPH-dependent ferric siderophore reductase